MKNVITIRRKQQKLRCPVCLDLLYVGDLLMSCPDKHAAIHKDCLGMVQTCPTLGCGRGMTVNAKFCKRPKVVMPSEAKRVTVRSKFYDRAYRACMDAQHSIDLVNIPIAVLLFCLGMGVLTTKESLIPLTVIPLILLLVLREFLKARREECVEEFGSEDDLEDYGLARLDGYGSAR
ncbi:MAG: hypothetical protein P1V97_18680 [Planctomycetota bacterium]|nr:hypothetical protein [Planctomycetota bacterium]